MKRQDRLYYLVQSLSKSEKRYVRLSATSMKEDSNYLKLFNFLEQQEISDDQAIRNHFKSKAFDGQLHVTKNYLRKLILKSLRSFYMEKSNGAKVRAGLSNIEILFNRELYELCEDEIKRTERIARKHDLIYPLIEVLDWKRRLLQNREPQNYTVMNDLIADQKSAIELANTNTKYYELVVDLSRRVTGQEVKIRNLELIQTDLPPENLDARVLYYNALYFWRIFKNEKQPALPLVTLIDYFETNAHFIRQDPRLFASSVNNLISYYIFNKEYKNALVLVKRTKHHYTQLAVARDNVTLLKQMLRTSSLELEIYRDTLSAVDHQEEIEDITTLVEGHKENVPRDYLMAFWFQLANIYFVLIDYQKALYWVNPLLDQSPNRQLPLLLHARFLNLMIHFELRNLFVLRYFVESTRRFVKKTSKLEAYQRILLRFFRVIGRVPSESYQEEFQLLNAKLRSGKSTIPPDALGYIDYYRWIESHL